MAFEIEFTQAAADQIRGYRKFEQKIVLDAMEVQLANEPTESTRNKKRLGTNPLADWELRVQRFRVFYDVQIVKVKAVGHKDHNKLYIGSEEVQL